MNLFNLTLIVAMILVVAAKEETKGRGKRQQISYYSRRGARPPPYAVQMEPIVQYSQRDPLYNPLASAKSDEIYYEDPEQHAGGPYGSSEPEPIIEIIIKESNETLPTPVPPTLPPTRPTKEPIQVFYVKYEKKDQGDGKSRVVYDKPVPALAPHEEHEEIKVPENSLPTYEKDTPQYTTPSPTEPSTTLRAVIRPDSQVYHSGSSGIRVTFGTDQLPPNNHNKRSDLENPASPTPRAVLKPSPSLSKRQHGPYPPLQVNHLRVPPAFPQQRIVNSFPPQQYPSNFPLPQQFQPPESHAPRQHRPPITIQGLPEIQQRLPFQSFSSPHRIAINHPQQPGFPPAVSVSHQSIHLQNQSPPLLHSANFNGELHSQHQQQQHQLQQYKQQEHDKQKYLEQRRQQELHKQREQQQRQQEIQRQQEQYQAERQRLQQLEQQRISQQENKLRAEQQQQQQQQHQQQHQQHQQYNHFASQTNSRLQQQQQQREKEQRHPEVLKAVPKLEQHYAIRENPLHPGPFPPNPQPHQVQYSQAQQQPNYPLTQQSNSVSIQQQTLLSSSSFAKTSQHSPTSAPKFQTHHGQPSFFSQNSQSQRGVQGTSPGQSIWGQPLFKDPKQKIFATPVPKSESIVPSSTPRIATYSSTTSSPPTTTTQATTSPRNEAKIKENFANLPDEVPDDIRDQLLSSGILGNADIQVLDYDKVGDIPIENLPPEALANFYSAGGGGAVAASAPVPAIAKRPKSDSPSPKKATSTNVEQATLRPGGVEMKVVRFDPNTAQGQAIADHHIREDATHLKPVTVGPRDDAQYNRYLPLKVSGASFPIPDVPELKDRRISSVVVLAPVDLNSEDDEQDARHSRRLGEPMPVKFLAGDSLKQLLKKPTAENYKKWLERESQTEPQKQSVVLLVTTPKYQANGEKEIFMYDVTSHTVSKLSGDLSSAFVDAAESNSETPETIDDSSLPFAET